MSVIRIVENVRNYDCWNLCNSMLPTCFATEHSWVYTRIAISPPPMSGFRPWCLDMVYQTWFTGPGRPDLADRIVVALQVRFRTVLFRLFVFSSVLFRFSISRSVFFQTCPFKLSFLSFSCLELSSFRFFLFRIVLFQMFFFRIVLFQIFISRTVLFHFYFSELSFSRSVLSRIVLFQIVSFSEYLCCSCFLF